MNKRLEYFDTAKGIGVFLVLIGHLQGNDIFCYSPYILPMCRWIFSFHMPFFFIISGMLAAYKGDLDKDFKTVAKRRFKGIMVPYYWFSFFYMTVVVYAYIKKQVVIGSVLINLWYVISCYGMSVLWFLPALFFGELLFIFIMKKLDAKKAISLIALQSAIGHVIAVLLRKGTYDTYATEMAHQLATALVRPFIACAFIAIGWYGFKLIEKYRDILITKFAAESSDTGLSTESKAADKPLRKVNAAEVFTGIVLMIIGFALVWINGAVDFRSMVFGNVPVYYICSSVTSFGLILICRHLPSIRLIKFFGVNSLIFMAVHGSEKVAYGAQQLAMYANQYLTRARGYICYAIIVTVITLYVCIMILLINRFVPFIAGKPFTNPFKHNQNAK